MNKSIHIMAVLFIATAAHANPYFRPLDVSHPQPVLGALLDPRDLGNTEGASLLPLITHSPKDGCLIKKVCEDWTPVAVGASMNAGKVTLDVAPLANVLPWMQGAGRAVVPDSWSTAQAMLKNNPDQTVTFSAGPVWQYRQQTNKGYLKVFTGVALHF